MLRHTWGYACRRMVNVCTYCRQDYMHFVEHLHSGDAMSLSALGIQMRHEFVGSWPCQRGPIDSEFVIHLQANLPHQTHWWAHQLCKVNTAHWGYIILDGMVGCRSLCCLIASRPLLSMNCREKNFESTTNFVSKLTGASTCSPSK